MNQQPHHNRYLLELIKQDIVAKNKVILIIGARQAGKTTLSKMFNADYQYLNYDQTDDRKRITQGTWDRSKSIIIFDELHKMQNWTSWLKGIFDTDGSEAPTLIVTGSAKLSATKKMGDSMAGRYFEWQLHPFDLKEAMQVTKFNRKEAFYRLLNIGGFPEPFLEGTVEEYNKWQRTHLDVIIRGDLPVLTRGIDTRSVEIMLEMLQMQVGSNISKKSIAENLQKNPMTIAKWLQLLEDLFIIFPIRPYSKNIARAVLKQPKYYFFDNGRVKGNDGAKLENLVACALMKEIQHINDSTGAALALHYIRNKEGKGVDFVLTSQDEPVALYEVKWKDESLSANLMRFLADSDIERTQIVGLGRHTQNINNHLKVVPAQEFLANLDFSKFAETDQLGLFIED